ncbi:SDR family oxidoreductase [Curtobacterium flaccumfaciens]|uniref:SDR family oxidoreductase n=1 Tax=Curtobacterium flaccumfaciens TaxID=2035 RepID=UPI00112BEC1D|nr:NAD-dependent epimerase/dehydratase family protein [Curtobacterium flaccumfaciens]TPG05153.1 NAD-dependent epimerase/dehydratase family protein [Curtobacterium flaccumfaciens]
MRVGITGGTGFVGRHLAERYAAEEVVIVSRSTGVEIDDVDALTEAFAGVDVVAHCAGINREIGEQTFDRVHVRGTAAVLEAARRAGVRKVVLLSFLRARPGSGSPYHESKWTAEEMVRSSGLDYTVLKAGMIYGYGDHLVDHLSHTVQTVPLFASVGLREKTISPIPVAELVDVLVAALDGRLSRRTVAVRGGETLLLSDAVRRVANVLDRKVAVFPAPVCAHRALGQVTEWTMKVPLVAKAQVRMLAEGVTEAVPPAGELPADLTPHLPFDDDQIRAALPARGGFTWRDLRTPSMRRAVSRSSASDGGR